MSEQAYVRWLLGGGAAEEGKAHENGPEAGEERDGGGSRGEAASDRGGGRAYTERWAVAVM